MKVDLLLGDCLEKMDQIPTGSVDFILCDLPYSVTSCDWDIEIPMDRLWEQYKRVIKPGRAIALFGTEPFSSKIRMSNMSGYRYDWIWEKAESSGGMLARSMPLKVHEIISVFYMVKTQRDNEGYHEFAREYMRKEKELCGMSVKEIRKLVGTTSADHWFRKCCQFTIPSKEQYKKLQETGRFQMSWEELAGSYVNSVYNPQMGEGRPFKGGTVKGARVFGEKEHKIKDNNGTRFPRSVIRFPVTKEGFHPTQKPVSLLEYLIKTYTNEGEVVLDNCMGSGSTGVAAINLGRGFIVIEKEEKYFDIAKQRIEEIQAQMSLFE